MVWQVHTTRVVDADAASVWAVLTDLESYGDWNPTVTSLSGEIEVGETLAGRLSFPNGVVVPFRPTVRVVDPERELRWEVAVGGRGTIDAEHSVTIEPREDGRVVLEQVTRVEGVLAAPLMGRFGAGVRAAMEAMGEALAEVAAERSDKV